MRFMKKMVIERVDMVGEGSNTESFIKLVKGKESDSVMTFEELMKGLKEEDRVIIELQIETARNEIPEATATELLKAKEDLVISKAAEVVLQEANEELVKAKPELDPTFEDMLKALPEGLRPMAQKMEDQRVASEQFAKQMIDEKLLSEALTKAKDIDKAPIAVEKLAELIKNAPDELVGLLKSMNALITDGAMIDNGGNGGGGEGNDAWAKIETLAKAKVVADPTLTQAKAIKQVIKEEKDLYKQYVDGEHQAIK